MSDNYIEDGIRDNAGHLALAGALMAHSQRKQQLQSLEASRKQQATIARTEAERLEVEKQRLKIEKLRQRIEKDEKKAAQAEKEAVRFLRVLMADLGIELDELATTGELKGASSGTIRDYTMAVLMSKLALVRSRSSSLSDLNDLKELARLEGLSKAVVANHFQNRDLIQLTRDKWVELESWMLEAERFKLEVERTCAEVPDDTKSVYLPSLVELVAIQDNLNAYASKVSANLNEHIRLVPPDAVSNGALLPELAEQAELEDLASGKQLRRSKAFANHWRQVTKGLLQILKASLDKLQDLQRQHLEHQGILQKLALQIEHGDLHGAEKTSKTMGSLRFGGLNYGLQAQLLELQDVCRTLGQAKRDQILMISGELKKQYPNAKDSSELALLILKHEQRAAQEKRFSLVRSVCTLGISSVFEKLKDHAFQGKIADSKELSRKLNFSKIGSNVDVFITPKISAGFCFIPVGFFVMGSPASEKGRSKEENQVEVTISQSFWLAKRVVTQSQWEAVMGSNPSHFKGTNLPVENVSWEDAQAFIAKLNEKQILPEGWKFALPSEAQWEYACRAGEKGPYSGGSLDQVGWYDGNSGSKRHEVGMKKANAWGLYDMHGNVFEWCTDWYHGTLKGGKDPTGPSSGDSRVGRGGSWDSEASYCRAATRGRFTPGFRYDFLGVRPALVPSR